jgi:hypothetical protein
MNRIGLLFLLLFYYIAHAQVKNASSFGYDENDATNAFVKAMNSGYDTIIIDKQKADWVLRPTILSNLHNKVVILEKGVVIKAKKNAFPKKGDVLLKFLNCRDLEILGYGASLQMNKEEYTDGEWRMTLSIINGNQITIKGLRLADSGGDGIYIDGWKQGEFSQNIWIEDVVSENHKRQGMSIISAQNVWVNNSVFKDTKGTLPEAGLDLEPDDPKDRMININFENCRFINNNHAGIVLGLNKLNSESLPVSISFKNCYLSMNHKPENAYVSAEIVFGAAIKDPVKGSVEFENLLIDGSDWGVFYSRKTSRAYKVTFTNCRAIDICKKETMPPVYLEVPDYFSSSGPLGGFYFNDFKISYKADLPFMKVRGSSLRTLKAVKDIRGTVLLNKQRSSYIDYIKYNPLQNRNVEIIFNLLKEN